jgi:hypothetical protein
MVSSGRRRRFDRCGRRRNHRTFCLRPDRRQNSEIRLSSSFPDQHSRGNEPLCSRTERRTPREGTLHFSRVGRTPDKFQSSTCNLAFKARSGSRAGAESSLPSMGASAPCWRLFLEERKASHLVDMTIASRRSGASNVRRRALMGTPYRSAATPRLKLLLLPIFLIGGRKSGPANVERWISLVR